MFVTYDGQPDPTYSGEVMELDLSTVQASLSGPKRPHDRVDFAGMKRDFTTCLSSPVGFKGFGLSEADIKKTAKFEYEGKEYEFEQGSLVIAAITSCTNTSNPDVMLAAGMLA